MVEGLQAFAVPLLTVTCGTTVDPKGEGFEPLRPRYKTPCFAKKRGFSCLHFSQKTCAKVHRFWFLRDLLSLLFNSTAEAATTRVVTTFIQMVSFGPVVFRQVEVDHARAES